MKIFKPLLLLLAVFAFMGAAPLARAVSFDFFYDNLEPYGEWVDVADYGYCWHPTGVDADWAPYTDGYWAYTDGGWTWVSYEEFGGITYHYGRWVRLEDEGWCWVPDYEWAPAWVSWRTSDDYVGWAPLPPRARFRHDVGFSVSVDADYDIGPSYYSFCEFRHFGDPALRGVIVDRSRNVTIINRSTNITNITVNRTTNNVFVGGPRFAAISARTARPIQVLRLRRETDAAAIRAGGSSTMARQQGNQLLVVAPQVQNAGTFKPAKVARTIGTPRVDQGWNGVKDPEAKSQLQTKIRDQAKGHEHAAAKQPEAQDLKIVDEKVKAASQPKTVTLAPAGTPAEPVAKGRNRKGQPQNELIAQPGASPATAPLENAKGRKKGQPADELIAQPNATPVNSPIENRKGKKGRVQANELIAQPGATPVTEPQANVRGKNRKVAAPITPQLDAVPTATAVPKVKREKPSEALRTVPTEPVVRKTKTDSNIQPFVTQPTQNVQPVERKQKRDNVNPVQTERVRVPDQQVQRQPVIQQVPAAKAQAATGKGKGEKKKTKEELQAEQAAQGH